jgi:hypothetical protein
MIVSMVAPIQASPATPDADSISLSNASISATWSIRGGSLRWQSLTNHFTEVSLPLDGSVFELVPKEGPVLRSADFKIVGAPVLREIPPAPNSSKAADGLPGRELRIVLEDPSAKVQVIWKAFLREGANYVRQEVSIHALHEPLALSQIGLIDAIVPGASVSGEVKGSPVTAGTWFLGFEHPLSECRVRDDRATCWLSRELPLQASLPVTYSSVVGVAHATQLRRDFLNYLELERAHPYRTFQIGRAHV